MDNLFDISELLLTRKFADLTKSERAYVLSKLKDEAEYNELRNIVLNTRDDEFISYKSKDNVMAAFDAEFERGGKKVNSTQGKYWPFLAAAASVAVLILIGTFVFNSTNDQLAEKKPAQTENAVQKDSNTVDSEKNVESSDTIMKEESLIEQVAELKPTPQKAMKMDAPEMEIVESDADEERPEMASAPAIIESVKDLDSTADLPELYEDEANEESRFTDQQEGVIVHQPALEDTENQSVQSIAMNENLGQRSSKKAKTAADDSPASDHRFVLKQIVKNHYIAY